MIFKIKTSKNTDEILKSLKDKTYITPNLLMRLAIAKSIRIPEEKNIIEDFYYAIDSNGFEINRHTLTGSYDIIYKCLMEQCCNNHLSDEEYFPIHIKFHIERGTKLLEKDYELAQNTESFIKNLARDY